MEPIFALDIGTRMVMGLLMQKNETSYEILASARTEHRQRAMYDGQVHNVEEVILAVRKVKEDLESNCVTPLKKVAVAAAGRSLITETAESSRSEPVPIRWGINDITALELEAVQQALQKAVAASSATPYHCVGYSVISYLIDGQEISSLVGQRGKEVRVVVIATFLPRTVIDSLVAVIAGADLELESLTLEPIAAGFAAIPENMRRMNLALVDVGAGTSDIALTKNGTFFAYGMVPMAGDEITEVIASKFLLDFNVAEKVKRDLNLKQKLGFTDFFGKRVSLSKGDLLNTIRPMVITLAERIATEIVRLNKGTPQAIILIGGGSLTPMLLEILAETIGLPITRVGIQVRERLSEVIGSKQVKGPDVITPVGIGISALENKGLHYYSVVVNDLTIPIFELQLANVAEALLAAGIQPRALLGSPGAALSYELNGELKIIKGTFGLAASITVNGAKASLDQTLNPGDRVEFTPGARGADAMALVQDVIPKTEPKVIIFNGKEVLFSSEVLLNDRPATFMNDILDGAKIKYIPNDTLGRFLNTQGINLKKPKVLKLKVNNEYTEITVQQVITVNGEKVEKDIILNTGDKVEAHISIPKIEDLAVKAGPIVFYVNDKETFFPPQEQLIYSRGKLLNPQDELQDGMELKVEGFSRMPILSEVLSIVNLPERAPNGRLITKVNGRDAEFTTQLHRGDRINIYWG